MKRIFEFRCVKDHTSEKFVDDEVRSIECPHCHNNWHGTKAIWRIKKMDELSALDVTSRRLTQEMHLEGDLNHF